MNSASEKIRFGCKLLMTLLLGTWLAGSFTALCAQETKPVATETLEEATNGIASDLAKALKANSQSEVFLGPIELVGIENKVALPLAKALEAQKIKIVPKTEESGKWRITTEANAEPQEGGGVHVVIECKLRPPVGATRKIVRYAVTSPEDIRKVSGGTFDVVVGDKQEQSKELAKKLENPQFLAKDGGKVVSAVKSPEYAIELLVQRGGKGPYQPVEVIAPEGQPKQGEIAGQPVVDLKQGDNYAIKVINKSARGAGVELEIDGINHFEFRDDVPEWKKLGKLYFHPGQSATITGWSFPGNQIRKFTVVNEQDGLHHRLGRPRSSVGFITVRFCAAWSDAEKPPADEEEFSRDGVATGAGEIDGKSPGYRAADTPKTFGLTRSQVSIRYSRPADLPPDLPKQ